MKIHHTNVLAETKFAIVVKQMSFAEFHEEKFKTCCFLLAEWGQVSCSI
jgi:hypothetical protein